MDCDAHIFLFFVFFLHFCKLKLETCALIRKIKKSLVIIDIDKYEKYLLDFYEGEDLFSFLGYPSKSPSSSTLEKIYFLLLGAAKRG